MIRRNTGRPNAAPDISHQPTGGRGTQPLVVTSHPAAPSSAPSARRNAANTATSFRWL